MQSYTSNTMIQSGVFRLKRKMFKTYKPCVILHEVLTPCHWLCCLSCAFNSQTAVSYSVPKVLNNFNEIKTLDASAVTWTLVGVDEETGCVGSMVTVYIKNNNKNI